MKKPNFFSDLFFSPNWIQIQSADGYLRIGVRLLMFFYDKKAHCFGFRDRFSHMTDAERKVE